MGKLRDLSGADVRAVLERQGFSEVRRRGSHVVMQKRVEGSTITVPVPNHRSVKIGTLLAIIRQSKVSRSEFER